MLGSTSQVNNFKVTSVARRENAIVKVSTNLFSLSSGVPNNV